MTRQFRPLGIEKGVTRYRADISVSKTYASVDKENKRLNVAGWVAGVIDQISPIHDIGNWLHNSEPTIIKKRDPKNQRSTRVEWATMAGVTASEARYQLLHNRRKPESVKRKLRKFNLLDSELH